VDRSQYKSASRDELRQIQREARAANSVEELRIQYERIQNFRRAHLDDFDLQISIAAVQDEIIEHARKLREDPSFAVLAGPTLRRHPEQPPSREHIPAEHTDLSDLPPNVQRLDAKTWQRATYLALFFAVILFAAFFYLVQTARRLNFAQSETSTAPTQQQTPPSKASVPVQNLESTEPPARTGPTLRLYTDLTPGTVSIDDGEPKELKDGELILDKLEPGRHSVKVMGRSGNAAFSFDVAEKIAPRIVGQPAANNVMAVLVSTEEGKGRLVTNVERPSVLLDGKPVEDQDTDGTTLENLGKTDHDLQVTESKDKQRFVLTYTPAPALTVYIKSDPNAGTVIVMTGQDGVDVFINNLPYRRKTDRGQVRIPLKVGQYTIRVHKPGFIDPPPQTVAVKKAEESAVEFKLDLAPEIATLQIKGALPGTMVYLDKDLAAAIGNDGNANISTVKPGPHAIELRREQALPKKFDRTFRTGEVIVLSGPDVTLDKVVVDSKGAAPPTPVPQSAPGATTPNTAVEIDGQHVRKGGGFVTYHVPKAPGHYTFQAQARKGGLFKRGKLQWYAGYVDPENYVMFTVDGKRATVREVREGRTTELGKIPFDIDGNDWVQVDLAVKPNSIGARVKTQSKPWSELAAVPSAGRDFTQDKVGFYIPGSDEVAVSNFRFSSH
jgi:hypothetical protein